MILVAQNHWGIVTGTFTSMIDTYLNLKQHGVDVKMHTISDHEKISEVITMFFKNSSFGDSTLMSSFKKDKVVDNEVVVCSARMLADCVTDDTIKIKAKKLIVLDSLDLARQKYGIGPNIDTAVRADECIFLINPANKGITNFKEYIYYHKFNQKRLDKKHFSTVKLTYRRSGKKFIRIDDGKYFENIGKGILEYAYKGYAIKYKTDGMFTKDGLCYYLELLGIDPFVNHNPLKIPKWKIKKHLFMHKNDLLLELI